MDIRQFRYFVAVAEALSFARAARSLNMSQPPLSRRIADLEGELGLRLFDRTSKKVDLTSAGEAFLPHAREAIRVFDAALRAARSLSPSQSRRLRIAFPPETSRSVLLDVISRLQQEQVEVSFLEAYTLEQQRLLAAGEVDVGVLRYPFDKRGLQMSPPLGQPLGVIIDAKHPLANLNTLHLRDLSPYPLVQFPRELGPELYDEILDLCRAGGYVPPRILQSGRMTAAFLKTQCAVTLAAALLLKRRGESGTKEFIWKPLEGSPIHWWTSVVCRSDECIGLTRVVVDVIFDCLQQHEHWVRMPRPTTSRSGKGKLKHKLVRAT
ncbi:LysR family transcriptional regulator [Bradyrhizobium brasilense]|uniref:LysR family transcriptional regulator n=1 Tax=Bradyrhizobium brasilense TaxID=1419277 RepID=UPI0024B18DF3|nr:LysR family transcriptional regulator [Bradyrhizobium australafricanum]WFU31358.1 LysR family transcriptional regulator [Bradyrhizobium australafricanum]